MEEKQKDKSVENVSINVDETNQEVIQSNEETQTPLEMTKRLVAIAERGINRSVSDEKLKVLFTWIYEASNSELLPAIEKLTDFETLTDELKKAGDILAKIINFIDLGFRLTDVPDDKQPFSEEHILFGEILLIADTEIRQYIPTPVEHTA